MIKNKYKADYQVSPRMDSRGRIREDYYYTGDYYCLPLDEAGKKKANCYNFVFGLIMLAIALTAGLLNPDSSRTAWIVFPYVFLYLPVVYMLFGAYTFAGAKIRMEKVVYDKTIVRMRRACWGVIVLSILNTILDLVYIILHFGEMNVMREAVYCVCLIVIAVTGIVFGRFFDRTYMPVTMERAQ